MWKGTNVKEIGTKLNILGPFKDTTVIYLQ